MFEAKLANAGLLKKIVESIKAVATDAPFDCSKNGISFQAMESSHVALVWLKLEAGLFDTYRCDRTINLELSLTNMSKALRCANNEDTCTLKFKEHNGDSVFFTLKSEFSAYSDVTIYMEESDIENPTLFDEQSLNKNGSVVCEMPSVEFQRTCKYMATLCDSINISATTEGIVFAGKGDFGTCVVNYSKCVSLKLFEKPASANFSSKYLNAFTKATCLSRRVRLSLSTGSPLMVEYPIEENGYLRFYLVPKKDDDQKME